MKLTPKDGARLMDLRRQGERPSNWNLDPAGPGDLIGKERFQQILKDASDGPEGTKVLSFTREEALQLERRPHKPFEVRLDHGVKVLFDVWGDAGEEFGGKVAAITYGKNGSVSREENGQRLSVPERYVQTVAKKLGFSDKASITENRGSRVWHMVEVMREAPASADDDDVGSPLYGTVSAMGLSSKVTSEKTLPKPLLPEPGVEGFADLCPIGRTLMDHMKSSSPEEREAFSAHPDLELGGKRGNFVFARNGWEKTPAKRIVTWLEQWLNHVPDCARCAANAPDKML